MAVGLNKKVRTVRPCEIKVGMHVTPLSFRSEKGWRKSSLGGSVHRVVAFNYPFLLTECPYSKTSMGMKVHTFDWRENQFRSLTRDFVAGAVQLEAKIWW